MTQHSEADRSNQSGATIEVNYMYNQTSCQQNYKSLI